MHTVVLVLGAVSELQKLLDFLSAYAVCSCCVGVALQCLKLLSASSAPMAVLDSMQLVLDDEDGTAWQALNPESLAVTFLHHLTGA